MAEFWSVVLIASVFVTCAHTYEFESQSQESGMIFIPLSKTQFTYTQWNLIYFYELDTYYTESIRFKNCINKLNTICNEQLKHDESANGACEFIVRQSNEQLADIENDENMIRSYEFPTNHRQKRWAPLVYAGAGWLAHSISSYISHDSARNYAEQIEKLQANSEYQKILSEEQITIMEQTIQLQNKTINDISKDIAYLERKIDSYSDTLNYIRWGQYFSMITEIASGLRDHHKSMTSEILRLISHTTRGEISRLIPIDQLSAHLHLINAQIPKNNELPINLLQNESIYNLFKASQIKSALIDNKIILEMRIPILAQQEYTLFRTIPIPIKNKNETILINTENEMFLTDSSQSTFIPFSEKEYTNCLAANKKELICKHSSPKYSVLFRACEMDILRNKNNAIIPQSCTTKPIFSQNYIIQMPLINKYYIFVHDAIDVNEICESGDTVKSLSLTSSGFLQIDPDCYMYNEQFTLHGKAFKETDGGIILTPKFNASIDVNLKPPHIENNNNHQFIHHDYSNEFGKIIHKLQAQKDNVEKMTIDHSDGNHSSVIIFIIVCITIIAVIFKFKQKIMAFQERYITEPISQSNLRRDSVRRTLP